MSGEAGRRRQSAARWGKRAASVLLPAAAAAFLPGVGLSQRIVLAGLATVLVWWTTGLVHKAAASICLLGVFLAFSSAPPKELLSFALSRNFVLICASFLFSRGIVNTRLGEVVSSKVLARFGRTPWRLVLTGFAVSLAAVLFIPQPFARVVLLAALFADFLDRAGAPPVQREVVLFGLFMGGTATYLLFQRADIALNTSALLFGGVVLSEWEWIRLMALPSAAVCALMLLVFRLLFRHELPRQAYALEEGGAGGKQALEPRDKRVAVIVLAVVLLWATQPLHGIGAELVTLAGVAAMATCGVLGVRDLPALDPPLLIFITAAYSIGAALRGSGITALIADLLSSRLPHSYTAGSLLLMAGCVMAVHMLLGSSITTLSVVTPILAALTTGKIDPAAISLLAYICVNTHYLLPFHHITIMVGNGKGYYRPKTVLRFGAAMTAVTIICIAALYLPWWRALGLW